MATPLFLGHSETEQYGERVLCNQGAYIMVAKKRRETGQGQDKVQFPRMHSPVTTSSS